MYNPFDLGSTFTNNRQRKHDDRNNDDPEGLARAPSTLPSFPPHVFPHPDPSSSYSESHPGSGTNGSSQIYPFSPPSTVHKGTTARARGRRGRIVSREWQPQPDPSLPTGPHEVGGGWISVHHDEEQRGGDVLRTGGVGIGGRRVGRGRARAVDCITGLPTPPQTKDNRMDMSSHGGQQRHVYPIGLSALPPTPASTVKTKRTIDYRNASGTRLDLPERVDEESEIEIEHGKAPSDASLGLVPGPAPGSGRTSRMFARQIGVDGSWQVDVQGHHHTGSGLAGRKRQNAVALQGPIRVVGDRNVVFQPNDEEEDELVDTDREGTPENKVGRLGSSVLLSAAPIPGMRKGNSFLQQLEAVAAEKKREEEAQQQERQRQQMAFSLRPATASSSTKTGAPVFGGDAGVNPFDDDEPIAIRRPTGMKGRLLSFGEPQPFSSDEEDDGYVRPVGIGRRMPSPAGMINFKSTKPSLSRSGTSTLDVPSFSLKPPAAFGNPFEDHADAASRQQPEAGPSSPISALMAGGSRKKTWTRPVAGGEDDPFAEKPGDLERMLERQKQFIRRPERPVMEFTFRGHKTSAPNPLYGLDATPLMARLPPAHPEFSPAPIPRPKFLLDKFMAQAESTTRESSAGSSSDETPSPHLGSMSITADGHVVRDSSATSKRNSQSILGKRSRSDQEQDDHEQGEAGRHQRPRSVSEQVAGSSNPETPARKRVRSSMHPVGNLGGEQRGSSSTPRSTVRKTGLHRL